MRDIAIRVIPMVSLNDRNSMFLGIQAVLSALDQNSGEQWTHSMASEDKTRRFQPIQSIACDSDSHSVLTSLIANRPSCADNAIMATNREVRSDCLAGSWRTNIAAY